CVQIQIRVTRPLPSETLAPKSHVAGLHDATNRSALAPACRGPTADWFGDCKAHSSARKRGRRSARDPARDTGASGPSETHSGSMTGGVSDSIRFAARHDFF